MNEKILSVIKQVRENAKKRNFPQTFDLVVGIKELDLKKAENKFSEDVLLPHGRGEDAKVVVFSDSHKDVGADVFTAEDLNSLAKNKRDAKKLVQSSDFFLAEAKLMPVVGKILGQFVGPKGKLPKLISGDLKGTVNSLKKSVRIRVKDAPVVQCKVGNEKMKDAEIAENVEAVLKFLEQKLSKGKSNIGKIFLKLTMSEPLKVEI